MFKPKNQVQFITMLTRMFFNGKVEAAVVRTAIFHNLGIPLSLYVPAGCADTT